MSDELDDRIESAALAPASIVTDGTAVTDRSIDELLAAKKHAANVAARGKNHLGLSFRTIIPQD